MEVMFSIKKLDNNIAFYIVSVAVVLYCLNQYTNAVINHDDWDFLFEQGVVPGYGTPWERTLWEGRWLNYLYYSFSQNLTGLMSFALFAVFYTAFIGFATYILAGGRHSSLLALSLFFSPIMGDLSRWPTTITPAMIVLATVTCIFALSKSIREDSIAMIIGVFLMVMTYPSISAIIYILYSAKYSWSKQLVSMMTIAFVLAYGASVISIYLLNYKFHNYFGLQIQGWREPNPLKSLSDVAYNGFKYLHTLMDAIDYWRSLFFLSCAGWIICCFYDEARWPATITLFAVFVCFVVELSIEIKSGITIAARSELWVWIAAFIPAAYLLYRSKGILPHLYGIAFMVSSIFVCLPFWVDISKNETTIVKIFDQINYKVKSLLPFSNKPEVVSYGEPRNLVGLERMHIDQIRHLQNLMWGAYKIKIEPCKPALCTKIKSSDINEPVFILDNSVILRFGK